MLYWLHKKDNAWWIVDFLIHQQIQIQLTDLSTEGVHYTIINKFEYTHNVWEFA